MCKNWIETGFCRYKNKCQFAHGEAELAHVREPESKNYKSKQCKTFHEAFICPYGSRCKFIHENRTFDQVHSYHYVQKLNKLATFDTADLMNQLFESQSCASKRLRIFEEMEECDSGNESFEELCGKESEYLSDCKSDTNTQIS